MAGSEVNKGSLKKCIDTVEIHKTACGFTEPSSMHPLLRDATSKNERFSYSQKSLRTTSTTELWDPSVTDKTEVVLVDEYTISGSRFGPK